MSLDPLLPTAPARVRALVLPIGRITADRFAGFVARLREEHVVCLRDVTADGRPNRNMFSPLAYPDGMMLYDLATHVPPVSHLALSPFDLYREPLAVVALADGVELRKPLPGRRHSTAVAGAAPSVLEQNLRVLDQQLEELRDSYPNALVHRVVIFDHDAKAHGSGEQGQEHAAAGHHPVVVPDGIVTVPPPEECTRTTIKTVMCDLSSVLLAEMTSLARKFEALTHIDSPGQGQQQPPPPQTPQGRWDDGSSSSSSAASRRASHMPALARSASAGPGEVNLSRLSMPAPFRPASTTGGASAPALGTRPTTPARSGLSNPPVTFDEMPAATDSGRTTPEPPRPGTAGNESAWGTTPGDRVSVQGFGPGSFSERLRSKGRGRAAVVVGSMYLQAGRWTDALRELNEAATIARSINDHVWHGKALELVLVAVLLMGWAGLEFVVPPALQPPPDKSGSSSSAPPPSSYIQEVSAAQPRHLQQLQPLIPDLLERILGLYSRVSTESLPTLPLSEAAIRFCKLLAALHLADGQLVKASLDMMVEGRYPPTPPICPRLSVTPSKQQIIRLALRAFPTSSPEHVTTIDRASILSGIASVLGPLGAHRKRAMVMRELVSVLVTGLVEARTRGAAEVGIHPAAGLVALNHRAAAGGGGGAHGASPSTSGLDLDHGDVERGIDGFLASLCASYGVVGFDVAADLSGPAHRLTSATARIQAHSAARFFGFTDVKLDVLRACINFCEALPDFSGVLRFAGDLLRTAGAGVAPGGRREYAWPVISRDEQVRLVNTIARASALVVRMGPGALGEYWDEFLVRSVVLEPTAGARTPVARPKSLLPENSTPDAAAAAAAILAAAPKNPFIYNAFAQADSAVDRTLVAGEPAAFRVTVQNPYDVELEIESIRIDVEGGAVDAVAEAATVGPYRTQTLRLWATPREAGPLVVTGAVVRVRGCRERSFSIFTQAWAPRQEAKPKFTGTAAFAHSLSESPAPPADRVSLKVIPPQPVLAVVATSLPQSAMMVLEGERQAFSVTLRNASATTPADLLLFSFEDSTQEPLKAALKSRDATTAELYEYELALVRKQVLQLRGQRDDNDQKALSASASSSSMPSSTPPSPSPPRRIAPGATAVFEFELLGRPGLTSAAIRINYGHLGVPQGEFADDVFYTRQVVVPLAVTVNASVELGRLDILAPSGRIPRQIWDGVGVDRWGDPDAVAAVVDGDEHGHCLAVLDFRNAFPALMTVRLRSSRTRSGSSSSPSSSSSQELPLSDHLPDRLPPRHSLEATATILPGHAARLLLPIPRIHIPDPHAPVPSLVPAARQRQFVVSRSVSADMERAAREAFWFREGVLGADKVVCEWSCAAGSGSVHARSGEVDLRGVRLSKRMIDALRVDDVGIAVALESRLGEGVDCVQVDAFMQLRITLANRTARTIRPALRVLPVLKHRPPHVALDHVRKFAWTGTLQRVLPPIAPGESGEVVIGAVALCRGEFEIGVTVEEVAVVGGGAGEKEGGGDAGRHRGSWSLRRPAVVVVKG